jgi:hypothetical protein
MIDRGCWGHSYAYRSTVTADAECSLRSGRWDNHEGGSADLMFTGGGWTWVPFDGGTCDANHAYYQDVTVRQAGPLVFSVSNRAGDTTGSLEVTVVPR